MTEDIKELQKDFAEALGLLDFKALDLHSAKTQKAIKLGLLWLAVHSLGEVCGSVEDELSDAEKYYALYEETKDPDYKTLAEDEMRHASILVKKRKAASSEEKT